MLDWFQKRMSPDFELTIPPMPVGLGGFLSGTHVASNLGWRPIEALCAGDRVLTFDHGMQTVVEMLRETIHLEAGVIDPSRCPLHVPRDALGNRVPMWLMPDQGVLLESDLIEDHQGDPFAVVPASTLDGYRGICRLHPDASLQLVAPRFEQDEVIYLEAGLLGYCAAPRDLLTIGVELQEDMYRVLPIDEAQELISAMSLSETLMTNIGIPIMTPGSFQI
ncbi:Hint domain-containing protein [Pseudophaeobacter flagellatus]|uniref:Hint domain-containing protein n=1 Tax=Pseudophaeobacter flagellatus TaxID=2899119 RepID=UPI001E48D796|nr:Hint domain-containing protein [Pseudophaeobacter flagellatus]MCD9147487.1 Hint domain-containing protein [Pseudophaeobacter flagellatus]